MAYGFQSYNAAYEAGRLLCTSPDKVFGVVFHAGRHFVEIASRETGSAIATILQPDFESMARVDGWRPRRLDGSLGAGIVRDTRTGFQWAMSWQEACAISDHNRNTGKA